MGSCRRMRWPPTSWAASGHRRPWMANQEQGGRQSVANKRRCSHWHRVAWQSWGRTVREARRPGEWSLKWGSGAACASMRRVAGGPAGGDWRATLGAGAGGRDRFQGSGGGRTAVIRFTGGPAWGGWRAKLVLVRAFLRAFEGLAFWEPL